jgi:hypothetical protein
MTRRLVLFVVACFVSACQGRGTSSSPSAYDELAQQQIAAEARRTAEVKRQGAAFKDLLTSKFPRGCVMKNAAHFAVTTNDNAQSIAQAVSFKCSKETGALITECSQIGGLFSITDCQEVVERDLHSLAVTTAIEARSRMGAGSAPGASKEPENSTALGRPKPI